MTHARPPLDSVSISTPRDAGSASQPHELHTLALTASETLELNCSHALVCSVLGAAQLLLSNSDEVGKAPKALGSGQGGARRGGAQPCAVRNLTELPLRFTTAAAVLEDTGAGPAARLVKPGETLAFESRVRGEEQGGGVEQADRPRDPPPRLCPLY